jgi:hypothetical protein
MMLYVDDRFATVDNKTVFLQADVNEIKVSTNKLPGPGRWMRCS